MICGSGGSKSRLAKAAGAEPAGQMRDEQLHAVVARSTFASEKAKSTSRSEHFWKLRCRKSAHSCGAKHFSKSTCTKPAMFGQLLEVEMSKKRTPVKSAKNWGARNTFGRSDVVSRGRRKGLCTLSKVSRTVLKTMAGGTFWRGSGKMHFAWQARYKRHVHQRC